MNHYEFLGVPENASKDEILAAYEKLRRDNPNPTNLKWAVNLQNAHDTLADELLRKEYDKKLAEEKAAKITSSPPPHKSNVSASDGRVQASATPSPANQQASNSSATTKPPASVPDSPRVSQTQRGYARDPNRSLQFTPAEEKPDTTSIDSVERKGLFKLTRFMSLGVIGLLCLALLSGLKMVITNSITDAQTEVTAKEVLRVLSPSDSSSPVAEPDNPSTDQFSGLDIPAELEAELLPTPKNEKLRSVVWGWIKNMTESQQQEYLEELASAVSLSEKAGLNRLSAYDAFNDLKQKRLDAYEIRNAEERLNIFHGLTTMAASLVLIALFSLILVMLAIERNTRGK